MTKKLDDMTVDHAAALIARMAQHASDVKMVADRLTPGLSEEEVAAAARQLEVIHAEMMQELTQWMEDAAVKRARETDRIAVRPASWPAGQEPPSPKLKPGEPVSENAHTEGSRAKK